MRKIIFLSLCLSGMALSAGHCEVSGEGIFGEDRLRSVLGQDGVTPIPVALRNGTTMFLWTFGDTLLGDWKGPINATATLNFSEIADMKAMPPNTLALSSVPDDDNYKNLKFDYFTDSGTVKEFLKYEPGENPLKRRFWADDGIQIEDTVYVYYMGVDVTEEKTFLPFKFTDTGLAKWRMPDKWDINKAGFERLKNFSIPDIAIGDGVIMRDGYVYLLGRASKNGAGLGSLCFARVRPADIETAGKYEYLTSSGTWDKKDYGIFFDDVCGEASLSYDEQLKKYSIVYMSAKTQEINLVTFDDFNDFPSKYVRTPVYKPAPKKDVFYYSAKEIFRTGKFIYIIYINPPIYQPMLVKITK